MGRRRLDLSGRRFGKLIVLSYIGKTSNGKAQWECLCDCGNSKTIRSDKLTLGTTKSCGCFGSQTKHYVASGRYYTDNPAMNEVMRGYWRNAAKRNYQWLLSLEQVRFLFSGDCFYCGLPASSGKKHVVSDSEFVYNGIDRLDSQKGYVFENCVSCCFTCNIMKKDMSVDEFLMVIKNIYEYSIKK